MWWKLKGKKCVTGSRRFVSESAVTVIRLEEEKLFRVDGIKKKIQQTRSRNYDDDDDDDNDDSFSQLYFSYWALLLSFIYIQFTVPFVLYFSVFLIYYVLLDLFFVVRHPFYIQYNYRRKEIKEEKEKYKRVIVANWLINFYFIYFLIPYVLCRSSLLSVSNEHLFLYF